MVARSYINTAKGAVNHVMHVVQAAREVAGHVTRVVVNTVGSAASAVGSAVKTVWNYCTGSARGAATCLAVAGSIALIASGVGAGAGVGLLATTLFAASSVASAVSFAQTRDPMDALGALPGVGMLKDAEIGTSLIGKILPKAVPALNRAEELHSLLNPIARVMRTTAVLDAVDALGNKISLVASSRNTVGPAIRNALNVGEIAVKGLTPRMHAEDKLLTAAGQLDLTPTAIYISRASCSACAALLSRFGL
jgi:hypothetical protein